MIVKQEREQPGRPGGERLEVKAEEISWERGPLMRFKATDPRTEATEEVDLRPLIVTYVDPKTGKKRQFMI